MKNTTQPKKDENKVVLPATPGRLPPAPRRGGTHKSAKAYNRRNAKKID